MNVKELRQLPSDELLNEIAKTRDKVFRMRFQGKGKDLENPGLLKMLRKDIARLHTVLRERQLMGGAAASRAAPAPTRSAPRLPPARETGGERATRSAGSGGES